MTTKMIQQSGKRERLVGAAKDLFHRQGYALTTLADIAKASEVPPGNVYYYFKTKDEIGIAVIDDLTQWFQQKVGGWEQNPEPRQRLLAFLDMPLSMKDILVQQGCPIGGLAQELNKADSLLTKKVAKLLSMQIEWVTQQYDLMGEENPAEEAQMFISLLQGSILLANTMADSKILEHHITRMRRALGS